jgi:glycosyltransferase involved in cell wall biosynthesis
MATHNGARFVREQIATILPQLGAADELVVVDDASTDDTAELVSGIADPRIRLVMLSTNVGYVRAFERALTEARNDFLLLADQDDEWTPGRVAAMGAALGRHKVVAGDLTTLDGPASIPGPYGQAAWRLDPAASHRRWRNTLGVLAGNRPYFGSAMGLRRDALDVVLPFPAFLRESHDLWIALTGIQLGSMTHLGSAVTARRYHDSNATPVRPRSSAAAVLRSRIVLLRLTAEARRRTRSKRSTR